MDTSPITPGTPSSPAASNKDQPRRFEESEPKSQEFGLEKYIRTFAGDIKTIESGGVPDLAPLERNSSQEVPTRESTAKERLVAASPIPLGPVVDFGKVEPAQVLPPAQSPPPKPVPQPPPVTPLKTYSGDFSDRMKETRASTATVLAAEQDLAPRAPQAVEKPSLSGRLYIIAGIILLVAGGVGAYFVYTRYLTELTPVVPAQAVSAPIFVDEREEISGTGVILLRAVEQLVTRPLAPNAVRLLYLESATTTDTSVFSELLLPAPGALLRNINAAQSMAGVTNVNGAQSLFFILSVTSYSDTFAAMLAWEPRMVRDLIKLFPPYAVKTEPVPAATSTAMISTTSPQTATPATGATPAAPYASGFFDSTIANHDVRIYRDTAGRDVLLYGYWNQTTLVIARDAAAFTEILGRLATSRTP